MTVSLSTALCGIRLASPLLSASGTFGYGHETADLVPPRALGAVITKTVTREPRPGNPPPRVCEVTGGMINAIGLQNVGIERFCTEKLPALRRTGVPVIVSIAGHSCEEYAAVAAFLARQRGYAGVELNLSCPNLQKRIISQDPRLVRDIVRGVVRRSHVPVFAKLSPQVADIAALAEVAMDAGAAAVSLVNTFPAMAIDVRTWEPKISIGAGGMSGPAVKPMAVRAVWEVYRRLRVPIIGGGGIMTAEDAIEFLLAGACAVTLGTALLVDPASPVRIAAGLRAYLRARSLSGIGGLVGKAHRSC